MDINNIIEQLTVIRDEYGNLEVLGSNDLSISGIEVQKYTGVRYMCNDKKSVEAGLNVRLH